MGKKIILKINEQQYSSIIKNLSENSNINSILQNLTPNKTIKLVTDDNDIFLNVIGQEDDNFMATDNSNLDVIFNKNSYNDTTKEFKIKVLNPNTNDYDDRIFIVNDVEVIEGDENEESEDLLFNKYYKDIVNNKNLQKAFYTAPTLWNYIVAKAKGEKAKGTGIYPAHKIISNYLNRAINDKFPGFTDKENLSAFFIVPYRIEIRYNYNNSSRREIFTLEAGKNKAVVRPYEPGFGDNKVLVRRNYGFKIVVKNPTGENNDQYFCDIYVEKRGVQPDTYKAENVKLTFLKSKGYEPQIKNN